MTIKVFEKEPGCLPTIIKKGDWIDLRTSEDIKLSAPYADTLPHIKKKDKEKKLLEGIERIRRVTFESALIPLGICVEMPKGFEGHLAPRSSTFMKFGILQTNAGPGIIDWEYNSQEDEWKMPVMATRTVTIPRGTRIAQFRIQLSQKATVWQKLRWLFSSKIEIKRVESLEGEERQGFGSTGEN